MSKLICIAEKCNTKRKSRLYCEKHWYRFKKYGSVELPIKLPKKCNIENCCRTHHALGYCELHYERLHEHGDPNYIRIKEVKKCIVQDCNNTSKIKVGLCHKHYEYNRRHGTPYLQKKLAIINLCQNIDCINLSRKNGLCLKCYNKSERGKTTLKKYQTSIKGKQTQKLYRKNNPHSTNNSNDLDLKISMDTRRKIDNNTCQWYGCGKNFYQAEIQVNHIFPKSEYPELKYRVEYMICYCKYHHYLWHKYRGDEAGNFFNKYLKQREKVLIYA